jgi:hypothetical protein
MSREDQAASDKGPGELHRIPVEALVKLERVGLGDDWPPQTQILDPTLTSRRI